MPLVPGLLTHSSFFVLISANGNAVIFTVVKPLQFHHGISHACVWSKNFHIICNLEQIIYI